VQDIQDWIEKTIRGHAESCPCPPSLPRWLRELDAARDAWISERTEAAARLH